LLLAQILLDLLGVRSDEWWGQEAMTMTRPNNQTKTSNGFAIPLQPDTQLGLAMLIAEDEDGQYEPVAVASTINEAKELAESDFRGRMRRLERGDEPGLCPAVYKLWAQGIEGGYRIATEIDLK
jgi:hypothetical protein